MLPVENVSEFPHVPVVQPVPQRVQAVFKGVPVADSMNALRVIQADRAPNYYIPPTDILTSALVLIPHETYCEGIGRAIYYDLVLNGRRCRKAAWGYPAPTARFEGLRDHIAFFPASLEAAFVGQVRVTPQLGDMSGGWVTPNLTGRIKGAMGLIRG